MRADGYSFSLNFASTEYRPITGSTNWIEQEMRFYVPADASTVLYGFALIGAGELWMDSFRVEVSDSPEFE